MIAGCTGTTSQPVAPSTPAPTTQAPAVTEVPQPAATEAEWVPWREQDSITLNPLGGYRIFSPSANGKEFRAVRVKVTSTNVPINVLYLTESEKNKFKKFMDTNAGTYETVARFDKVHSEMTEASADEPLNVVLLNTDDKLATPQIEIWYKDI
ncbi:MAG: hypothetical protein II893_04715 [Methanomicrobium sp.]|nr:hypothetical protein [Methanomicrobium sp.]MBQ3718683.1 hypothetical protein [Methanomicrobium sp.]